MIIFKGAGDRTFFHLALDWALVVSILIHALLLGWDSLSDRKKVPLEIKNPLRAFLYRQPLVLIPPTLPRGEINEERHRDSPETQLQPVVEKTTYLEPLPLVGNRPLWSFNPADMSEGMKQYQSQIQQQQLLSMEINVNEGRAFFKEALLNALSEETLRAKCVVNLNHQDISCEDTSDITIIKKLLAKLGAPPYSPISGAWVIQISPQTSGGLLVSDRP